ncbi:MAG: hypothetical protein IBX43_08195 [Campylobacterales bacterium]|nr:hypothetical protein [Campylobacterales bacterium]
MPFTSENKDFFGAGNYVDGKNYVMEDADAEMPFRSDISEDARKNRVNVVD